MADFDFGGERRAAILAILALTALNEAGIAQFAEDRVEEFLRDMFATATSLTKASCPVGSLAGDQCL